MGASSYLVTAGTCSCDLIHGRRTGQAKADLLGLLAFLLDREHSVHLLLHWTGDMVTSEAVNLVRKEPMSLDAFTKQFPQIDTNVRYIIVP